MASRSRNHHSRHDDPRYEDPYTFDDPYRYSSSSIKNAGYEYVGTDEASNLGLPHRAPSPDPVPRRRPSPPRRDSRTTSPPRRSRHHRGDIPPLKSDRRSSPPRTSRRTSPPPRGSKKTSHDRYQKVKEFSQRPAVKRTKSIGQQGFKFISEAAAMYAAAQGAEGGGGGDRERSESRDRSRRSSHHEPESRHRHHHRRRSPTPSPSPVRRRSRAYSDSRAYKDEPPRRHRRHRSPSVSDESDYDRDRGRGHRRSGASSYTRSPSTSSRIPRSRKAKSVSSTVRSGRQPDQDVADRWQMAARAALEAGGLTAFRLRKEPGKWTGEKGAKIATAALGAAAIDAFIDKDPRRAKTSGMKSFAENTVSSLIASKIMGFKGASTSKGQSRY